MNTLLPFTQMIDAALNGTPDATSERTWRQTPRADILEGDTHFLVNMDLPGVSGEDLDISLENQTLEIKATRAADRPEGFEGRRRERPVKVEYSRSFNLGNSVDADNITAKLDNGVLQITLAKSKGALPRRIEVK